LLQLSNYTTAFLLFSYISETRSAEVCEDRYYNGNLEHVFIITCEQPLLLLPVKQGRQPITKCWTIKIQKN